MKISELLEETERLHEQALSRRHEVKDVLGSVSSFMSTAESLSAELTAFKAHVHKQVTKPVSADIDVIKADLQLLKVFEIFLF